jgi:2-C-methyl-D-erythritol 2,4-cyclodiphosphate synthase
MTVEDTALTRLRIGQGIDVHRFSAISDSASPGFKPCCILGGVRIPYPRSLEGHSDADVLLHAIIDALLGAAGKADIGNLFPDSDEQYRGISSMLLLERAWAVLKAEGYELINIDSCVLAQSPRIAPHISEMKARISETLSISPSQVGIKATTTERLGFVGREEGITATAAALVLAPKV